MLENLKLDRVVAHQVLTAAELQKRAPQHSASVVEMDTEGRDLVCARLIEAIGSDSHCEEMLVSDEGTTSTFQTVCSLLGKNDKVFVSKTSSLADRLSAAQTGGSVKEGLGVFLQGTVALDGISARWIAILKADPDHGLVSEVEGEKITLRYVANMIMGAQQRLLKVALFIEESSGVEQDGTRDPENFSIRIYDHLLSNSGRGTSALYFYSTFLGLKPAENSAKLCRTFLEKTRAFTDDMSADNTEKITFRGHLTSYLRSEKTQISVKEFADTYLPKQHRRAYMKRMKEANFPEHAVRRDIRLIKTKLRKQSLRFTSAIVLVGSDDALQKSVIFDDVVDVEGEEWTSLKIKGKLE